MASHHHRRRKKPRFHRQSQPGASPGTLHAAPDTLLPVIQVIASNADRMVEAPMDNFDRLSDALDNAMVIWINVGGLDDAETIRKIGERFGLHSLALKDVINVHQRAKVDPYSDYLFIVTRRIVLTAHKHLQAQQIRLFLGKNYVLTFQQQPGDCFDPVRDRIRTSRGRTRTAGADYLACALIDAVIDSYFPIVPGVSVPAALRHGTVRVG